MTDIAERAQRAKTDKFSRRRRELAEVALVVIADQGFARTGLRDIAHQTDLSHGVLHYYFEGKDDLIAQAIWQYKSECARRYDPIIQTAVDEADFVERISAEMADTLRDEASLHRLWYDLRNQALFDSGFSATIVAVDDLLQEMVWAVISRYAQHADVQLVVEAPAAYALFDGMFHNALIRFLRGDVDAPAGLRRDCAALLRALR